MKYHKLLIVTLPGGDPLVIIHEGNPDVPQGTIQHVEINFTSRAAADMIKRVIQSEGLKDFIRANYQVVETTTNYSPTTDTMTSEEAIAAIKESTLPTPRIKKERKKKE